MMIDDIQLREARVTDASSIALIHCQSWQHAFSSFLRDDLLQLYTDVGAIEKKYHAILNESKNNGTVLSVAGKDAAFAFWGESRTFQTDRAAEIICIHSLPQTWGNGYGTILMNSVLQAIRKHGFADVCLWVFEANQRALSFYESLGFLKTAHTQLFLENNELMYLKRLGT